ncbi:MAG TPA: hypothetical protein VJ438_02155 [Candidatus Nanoarchaeia archaeon]|nr:hypothetical protein [Candidatus Nanoarchaeia archaeon]
MVYKYRIETRRLETGNTESRIDNSGHPIEENQLSLSYQQTYREVTRLHKEAIKLLGLEKVTTEFCEANME